MDRIQQILTNWMNATPKVLMVCLIISVFLDLILTKKLSFLRGLPAALGQKSFWLQFLPGICLGGLVIFDAVVIAWVQSLQVPIVTAWIRMGAHIGRWVWLYVALAYWVMRIFKHTRLARILSFSLFATTVTAILTHGLKFLIARARPYENLGALSWFNYEGGIQDRRGFQSFPSGDSAVVAGVAFFLFYATPSRYWRWLWLVFPLATAFSRMSLNRHWPTDTLGSFILANAIAWLFFQLLQQSNANEKAAKVSDI